VLQDYVSEYSEVTIVLMEIAVAKILLRTLFVAFSTQRRVTFIISRSAFELRGVTEARCWN